ncbi:DUF2514 family protein [Burkholderia sp. AU31652]|uniref:DUF2514 family protein n=1 Tax=Burkholderia sp. AU31652 TaxID=2015354 RepID=UPI0015C647DD|nr:DUF2514 family protein [Burkholderia sp. AU31652]
MAAEFALCSPGNGTDAITAARKVEQRRVDQQTENANNAKTQRDAALAAEFAARATAASLRGTVDSLVARARSAAAGDGPAGADAIVLFADVFGESVERNEALASALDRARIAGNECAADCDALTASQ